MQFDHVGVVVPELGEGRSWFTDLLSIREWTAEVADPVNGVYVQFGRDASGMCYELIAPIAEESPVSRTLASGDNILAHVAYLVPDLAAAAERLRQKRCFPIGSPKPAIAYGGSKIQFFFTPLRLLIELIEAPGHRHSYKIQVPAG
jgi:methylmalonyl-CoA/ethylmalonyl-CoA epimerase